MTQIKVSRDMFGWFAYDLNDQESTWTKVMGSGKTIQEAIEDFLKQTNVTKYTWK